MSALRRRPNRRLLTTSAFGALALAAVWAAPAHAQLVQGGTPAQSNGTAPTIDQSVPNTTTVTLGGSRTVIDWNQFDINSGDTANFVFANRSDIVLNRVGGAGSTINGNLNGTIGSTGGAVGGNIWIYNANGVVIGANARVSTGGLLVTTAALDRATDSSAGGFLDGSATSFGFTGAGTGNITVQNGAQIASHGGAIALVAPVVTTEAGSSISANDGGNVLVGSAAKYKVSFRPTSTDDMDLLSFEVADGAGASGSDAINLAGDISGNRVFVAAVSKSGLVASIMSTGTISANTVGTDETGAIVLSANHDIVNGAAAAAPLSGIGEGHVSTYGGSVAGPKVDFVASENVLLRGDVGEAGATVNLHSDNTDVKQYAGVITADTLTASAQTGINFNSFSANRVDKLGVLSTVTGDLAYIGDEDGVILTGAISAPGKVTLGARGFMDTTTGSITAGSLELSLGGGGSFKVNGDANLSYGQSQGAVMIHATGGITLSNEFGMILGDTLTLTADTGAIRETGGFISGGGAVVANAAGEIDLGGANSFTSLTANSADGERVTVNATGNLDFKVNTFSVARFTVGGNATSSGTNALIAGGLFVTAGGAINLSSDGGDAAFGDLSAGGNIAVTMDGDVVLGGVIQAGNGGAATFTSNNGAIRQVTGSITAGSIVFDADSTITQSNGAFIQTGGLSLTSGGTVTMGSANSFTSIQDLHAGGDLTLRNAGTINLTPVVSGGYTAGGELNLTSDAGDIIGPDPITASRITASAWGSIGLSGAIDSLGAVTAGGMIGISSNRALSVTGNVVAGTNVSLSGTSIGQGAGTAISGNDVTLNASAGAIDQDASASIHTSNYLEAHAATNLLLRGANDLGYQDAYLTGGTGKDVTIRSIGDFRYNSYGITVGTLTLISDAGSIRQGSGIYADTLIAQAATGLRLDGGVGNTVTTVGGLTTTSGDIMFVEGNGFDIAGDISAPGLLQFGTNGDITTSAGHLSAGTLEVTAGGGASFDALGNIRLGAVNTSGGEFSLATTGDIDLTGAVSTSDHNLYLYSSNGAITTHGGTVSNSYPGAVYATAQGGIDLTGAGSVNIWATSTGGGNINLSGDADVYFMVSTAGDLTVTAAGSAGNSSDVTVRSVGITAGTGISLYDQTVNVDIGSYRYLTVADGYIDIENQRDIKLDGNVTAGGGTSGNWVRLNSSQGSLLQNSGTITGYSVELDAAQSVSQDASAKVVVGDYGLSLRATDVSLIGANEFSWINTYTVTHDLTLRAVGTIDMSGSANQAGSNHYTTLISDTGNIIGGPIVSTRLSATATNGKLVFTYGNNQIGSLGDLTAKNTGGTDIDIFTDSTLGLTGNITGGGVILHATQGINQTAGAITADRLAAGTSGNLLLGGANNFGTLTEVGHGNGTNVTIRNLGSIVLPTTSTTFGTLTLTSDTGSIGQTDAVTAATLIANAATGINLAYANNFTALDGLITAAGDIRIADTNGFAIEGDITAPGTVALASGGNITTGTTTVGIVTTPHGKVDADTLTVSAVNATVYTAGDIKLGASSVISGFTLVGDGSIDLTATSNFFAASLIANTGSITQSAGILTGNTVLTGAAGSITLAKANSLSSFGGTSQGGGAVTFNNAGTSTLDLSISTTGNAVVTTAGGVLGAYIRAGDLSLTAGGAIDLTFNTDVSSISKLATTSGNVLLTDANSFQITGDVTAGSGTLGTVDLRAGAGAISQLDGTITGNDVHLTGSGNLSQVGNARIVANTIALSGYAITFNGANSFNSTGSSVSTAANGGLILRNAGSIDLDAMGGYTSGSTLALTSDNGSITSTGAIAASSLSAVAEHGTVSFGNAANSFIYLGAVSASGDATITTGSTSLGLLNNISVGGRLTLGAQGAITQSNGTLTAASLYATAGGATGAITLGAANDVGTLGALTADGDVSFHDINGFQIAGNVRGDHVTLIADAGAIRENSGTVIANHLTASAVDGLVLNQIGNQIHTIDGLTNSSNATNVGIAIASDVDMHLAGDVSAPGQYVSFYVGSGSLIQDSGTITAGALRLYIVNGNAVLGANALDNLDSIRLDNGDFIANSNLSAGVLGLNGNIVVSGTTTITNAAGITQGQGGVINTYNLNLNTAGTLDMGNVINIVGGQANITMGSGSFLSYGDLNLRLNATGAATITSQGNINFTGAGSSSAGTLTLSAANGIYSGAGAGGQIAVDHLGTVTNSGSGGIALNLLGNVLLEGDITAAGQTVSITAEDGLSQASGNVITANRLNVTTTGPNASAILDNANVVGAFGLNVSGDATLRSTLATTIASGMSVGGSLTVNSPGDIVMAGGSVGGTLALHAGGAVNGTGYVSADLLTGSAEDYFYLNFTNLNTLDTVESGSDIQINASSSNLNVVGDVTAAGGMELSGHTLSQSAGTITAANGIGLSTDGAITQTGTGRIIAGSISAVGGDISLLGANQIGTVGNYLSSGGTSIAFRNQGSIEANSDFRFYNGRGALTLISDTGSITQSVAVDATSVTLSAATGIDFSNAGNTIDAIGGLTSSTSGGIAFRSQNSVTINGDITGVGQTVTLASGGALTQNSGGIVAGSLNASADTGISLTSTTNNVGTITGLSNGSSGGIAYTDTDGYNLTGNIAAAGQTLSLAMAGAIGTVNQTGTSVVSAGLLNMSGGQVFSLRGIGGTGNHIDAIGNLGTGAEIYTNGNVDLTGTIVTTYLDLRATGGNISQSGGSIDSSASGSVLELLGNNIALTRSGNRLGGANLTTASGSGDVTAVSTGNTSFGSVEGGNVSLTVTGGNLSGGVNADTLTASTSGTISLTGRIITLGNVGAGGDAAFNSSANLTLNGAINIGTGRLTLATGGGLTQMGGSITAGGLDTTAGTSIAMTGTNNVGTIFRLVSQTGGITYTGTNGFDLAGNVTAGFGGNVSLATIAGSISQSAGIITAGQLSVVAGNQIILTQANQVARLVNISGSGGISFTARDTLELTGGINSGGAVTLASLDGAINQTGGAIGAASLSASASTGLDLFMVNNTIDAFGTLSTATGNLRLRNMFDIGLSNLSAGGDVTLETLIGAITQGAGTTLTASGLVTLTAQNGIVLDKANSIGTLGTVRNTSTNGITITNAGDLVLLGDLVTVGQNIVLTSNNGAIRQQGGTITGYSLSAQAQGAISLDRANDIDARSANAFLSTGGDISFRSINAILLGSVSTPGLASFVSDTGGITQSVGINVGALSATALDGDIVFDQGNTIGAVKDIATDGSFTLNTLGNLALTGAITAPTLVKLTAGGAITQNAATSAITTAALQATGPSGISLLGANDVGTISLDANGNDLRFRNLGDIAIGTVSAAGHTIQLISDTGSVTQDWNTGSLIGSVIIDAAGAVTLGATNGNQLEHVDVKSGGDVDIYSNGSGYGSAITVDRIEAAGHRVTLNNGSFAISGGNITADYLYVFGVGVDLTAAANNVATLNLHTPGGNAAFTNTGNLLIDGIVSPNSFVSLRSEQGAITQTGGAIVQLVGLTAYGRDGVSLAGDIQRIDGVSAGTGADVSFVSTRDLEIAGDITARNLRLRSNNSFGPNFGALTQTGGSISASSLLATAYGAIDLRQGNHIGRVTELTSFTNAAIRLTSLGRLTLDGNVTGGNLSFNTGTGALEQVSGILTGGHVDIAAGGDVTLDGANAVSEYYVASGGDATLRATGALRIGGQAASMTVRAGGMISQLDTLLVGSLDASTTSGAITLNFANQIGRITGLSGAGVTVNSSGDLEIAGDVTGGSQASFFVDGGRIAQTSGTVSATSVTFDADTDIDQAPAARIVTNDFTGTAGTGLSLAGPNQIASVALSTTSGNLLFRNQGDLDAAAFTTPGDLTLISDTGSITQSAALSIGGAASFRAAGDITLDNGANSFLSLGVISAGGDLDLRATNLKLTGNVTAQNIWFRTGGDIDQSGGIITATSLGGIADGGINLGNANQVGTIGELRALAGDLTLHVVGNMSLTDAIAAAGHDVTLISDTGSIVQATNPDAVIYGATLSASAGGDITLGSANQFGVLSLDLAGNASVKTAGNVMLTGIVDVGGNLSLTSGGGIASSTITGGVAGTLTARAQTGIAIAFDSGDVGAFGDQITAAGDVSLQAQNVRLTGTVTASGAFRADALSGSVTQSAGSVITAASAAGSATGNMLLGGNNTIRTILGLTAAGDLSFKTSGALDIAGTLTAGASSAMTLTTGGDIRITGADPVSGGTLNVFTTGAWASFYSNPMNPRTVSFSALGNVSAGNFEIYNAGSLDLTGNFVATMGVVIDADGQITQSAGTLTAGLLTLNGYGIAVDRQNQVNRLQGSAHSGTAFSFTNARDLILIGNLGSGDVTLNVDGNFTNNAGILTYGDISITAAGGYMRELSGNKVTVQGGANDLAIDAITTSDDVSVTGTGNVAVGLLHRSGNNDVAGDGYNALISGGNVKLGADSGSITGSNVVDYSVGATPGTVTIQATGNATLGVDQVYNAAINISAAGNVYAESNNQLLLGNVSGANITLLAGTDLTANSIATSGVYSVTAGDIGAGAFNFQGGNPLDILITDTAGDLTLSGSIAARRNTTVTAAGNVLGGTATLAAGLAMDGTLTVNGTDITLGAASSAYDVTLNGTGAVDVGQVSVGQDYVLKGSALLHGALSPIGDKAGSWTLTSLAGLNLGGLTLNYKGNIDFHVAGLIENGSVWSMQGAVTGEANAADLSQIWAATNIDVSATAGALRLVDASATLGSVTLRGNTGLTVTGGIEAGTDVNLTSQFGSTIAGSAKAGGNISVFSLTGNAILRQAKLTGAAGTLSVQSISGAARLGADDASSITTDNYFERAAGAAGNITVAGATSATVNLHHSAALDLIQAGTAEVNLASGDLSIGLLWAQSGNAKVLLSDGSLSIGSATGTIVNLRAIGGGLTLGAGGVTANDLYLTSDGVTDTTAVANLSATNYLYVEGGTVRAASLASNGNAAVYGTAGGITIDEFSAGGNVTVSTTTGDLAINQVSIVGSGQLTGGSSATIRDITATGGFALQAQGNVTLGADAGATPGTGNAVSTGGTLGGASGGGRVVSLGGNVSINLFGVTGVFDEVRADAGDVAIAVGNGDLGINQLRGHNIGAAVAGVLTMFDVGSSGGSYRLTAADFGGDALNPTLSGGASALGDITIIDTAGDLGASGVLLSSGDIHVEARHGAITGLLSLDAQGDVTAIGQGVRLYGVSGHNVTIDAGTGTANIVNSVGVENNYTLTAGDFAGETLAPGSARAGSLTITDTAGNFDFGSTDLSFGGAISISATQGLLNIGNLRAGNAISLNAATDLSLASAGYYGTGANSLSLIAGGDLRFGAADAASITTGNVFTNHGASLTGTTIRAGGGNVAINLYESSALGAIEAGTLQIAVTTGNFSAGDIDAVGAIVVQGPSGRLALGDVTTSAGHINISGQGNTSLGDVFGHFVVNLGASTGSLTLGHVTGGDVSLQAAGAITGAGVSAATLGVVTVNGDVDLDAGGSGSHVARLTGLAVNGGFRLRNLADLALDGAIEVGGALNLGVAGALSQSSGHVVADRLEGQVTGATMLGGDNRIGQLGDFSSNGLKLSTITALTIDGAVQGNGGAVVIASHGGMTIGSAGSVTSAAAGDAITLASDGRFTNLAGASTLSAASGRWLVYTQSGGNPGISDPNNDFGGLAGVSYYGDAYDFGTGSFATAPNAGNRFVYGYRPVLTVTPSSLHIVYDGTTPVVTATITGLINGDSAANAWSGAAEISGVGSNAGTYFAYSALGTLASEMGYGFTFVPGTVIIDPRTISAVLNANDKTYDGTMGATGTLGLSGVIAGDTVGVSSTGLAFDSRNAGTRTVTAGGLSLSGADAGNYVLSATSVTDLADILAKAITATLSANGKTYDGTTAATGSLSLAGLVGTDQVSANGSLAFDSRNAGIGRTVTAGGITLSGADAGNYTVNATATALADILAKTITATLSANGKTYDGTTAATGTLGLDGVVVGDAVSATSTGLAFDNRNAGAGRTVTASGLGLSGADAGNYVLSSMSVTALADILAKAITVTLSANGKTYDGTTAATGSLSLGGVLSGDQVSVGTSGIVFDSKNAGTRTATAGGLTLDGADAGNYTISGTATGTAVIGQKAITATATADSRGYDGSNIATGRIALTGLIAGDTVTGTASYRFADANAGTGRTVQVSGLALTGADAANYSVTLSATPVTADVARRAVTVTVNGTTKIFGQPDPVFGYTVSGGSVVGGDGFSGALAREAGEQVGRYAIGQGTLALSANYLLTVVPGTLVISFTQSGADAGDALKMLQSGVGTGFSLNQDPSRNLEGDGEGEEPADGGK
ncbi:YDG domain-containing protein [Sphingomonas sp. Sphisp140]|uniref:YDG domain-containing protein n=1 Tax=Sphingomonas sp. Sphisp140 TaxID=3243019 RepID=UPI0039B088C0